MNVETATGKQQGLQPAIELRNVSLSFPKPDGSGRLVIYEGLDLDIDAGAFVVILGPSGCGKSTLLNVIDTLVEPASADAVRVLGRDVRTEPDVTRNVAYVFQNPRLLPWMTLWGNAEIALEGLAVQPRSRWRDLLDKYFEMVGLADYAQHYPHQVSGGMQGRAAIVRAWVNEPQVLLMDEPFSHLDEITAAELRRELSSLWRRDETRRTVVFVTHDLHEAVLLGDRIIMLTDRPARIFHDENIDLPWPRDPTDERLFDLEARLRRTFSAAISSRKSTEAVT